MKTRVVKILSERLHQFVFKVQVRHRHTDSVYVDWPLSHRHAKEFETQPEAEEVARRLAIGEAVDTEQVVAEFEPQRTPTVPEGYSRWNPRSASWEP